LEVTPRTLVSWKAAQASPASISSLETVLIETPVSRALFEKHGEDLDAGGGGTRYFGPLLGRLNWPPALFRRVGQA
jgi:hypothetical protein